MFRKWINFSRPLFSEQCHFLISKKQLSSSVANAGVDSQKLSRKKKIKEFEYRSTLQGLLISRKNDEQRNTIWNNKLELKILPLDGTAKSFFVLSFGSLNFYINPCREFFQKLHCVGKKPLADSILLTKCNYEIASSVLPNVLTPNQLFQDKLNIYGPIGTRNIFTNLLPNIRSQRACDVWKNALIYYEPQVNGVFTVDHGPVAIKMLSCNVNRKPCVVGYLFRYEPKSIFKSTATNQVFTKSWKDFETLAAYMEYVKLCKDSTVTTVKKTTEAIITLAILDFSDSTAIENVSACDWKMLANELSDVSTCIHIMPKSDFYSFKYLAWLRNLKLCENFLAEDLVQRSKLPDKSQNYRALLHTMHPSFFPLYNSKQSLENLSQVMYGAQQQLQSVALNCYATHRKVTVSPIQDKHLLRIVKSLQDCEQSPAVQHFQSCDLYPHLVTLGSGSTVSNSIRASASYLLRITKSRSILIDCGSNTLSQLIAHYGFDLALQVGSTIKAVVLTHKHSDHWSGFYELIMELVRAGVANGPLTVFLPKGLKRFFGMRKHEFPSKIALKDFETFRFSSSTYKESLAKALNVREITPVRVDHGPPTYGIVIRLYSGHKITYSSDTLPKCQALIGAGKDSHLLIHDCLYLSDSEKLMAEMRMHSTLSGAIRTAEMMKAKTLMLTHFANVYPALPLNVADAARNSSYNGNIVASLDHLELPLNKIQDYYGFLKDLTPFFTHELEKPSEVYKKCRSDEVSDVFEKISEVF